MNNTCYLTDPADMLQACERGDLQKIRELLQADSTLVNAKGHSYLVTSYNDFNGAAQAVQAALNTHATLAAGLRDAVSRLTTVDNAR